jgi:hypothetical protein
VPVERTVLQRWNVNVWRGLYTGCLPCLEHRCWLIARGPACRRSLRSERPAVSVCRCGKSFADTNPVFLGAAAIGLAETLEALFVRGVSCLPEMSAGALCWWKRFLTPFPDARAETPQEVAL